MHRTHGSGCHSDPPTSLRARDTFLHYLLVSSSPGETKGVSASQGWAVVSPNDSRLYISGGREDVALRAPNF